MTPQHLMNEDCGFYMSVLVACDWRVLAGKHQRRWKYWICAPVTQLSICFLSFCCCSNHHCCLLVTFYCLKNEEMQKRNKIPKMFFCFNDRLPGIVCCSLTTWFTRCLKTISNTTLPDNTELPTVTLVTSYMSNKKTDVDVVLKYNKKKNKHW